VRRVILGTWVARPRCVDDYRAVETQVTRYRTGASAVLRRRGPALAAVAAVAGMLLALRGAGRWLVVEEPLASAPAIVVLGGGSPAREQAAAEVFRDGWAPRVVLVPATSLDEKSGVPVDKEVIAARDVQARRSVLEHFGVSAGAVLIASRSATNTLTELEIAAELIQPDQEPVILVTSPYHARRVQLTWRHVTGGRSAAILRTTHGEAFDPSRWWTSRLSIDEVTHEYLGLVNALFRFRLGA
jgi:uncharacterized SAM-binding protein YcdF (DUF218 family)